jgi:hypothetical protein
VRYVLIRDDATVDEIDDELRKLRAKREAARYPIVREWISADIDKLLEMRTLAVLEAMA